MKEGYMINCACNPDIEFVKDVLCEKCYQKKKSAKVMNDLGFET